MDEKNFVNKKYLLVFCCASVHISAELLTVNQKVPFFSL